MPLPLSLKRNGQGSEILNQIYKDQQDYQDKEDSDYRGNYFGASIRRGPFMTKQEDRLAFREMQTLMGQDESSFFAVFDGHAGYEAAQFCCSNLERKMMEASPKACVHSEIERICKEMDDEFLNYATHFQVSAGTTMLFSLLQKDKLFVSNIGDSSAMLIKSNGQM